MSTKSRFTVAALALLALGSLYFGRNVEGNKSLDCEGGIPLGSHSTFEVNDGVGILKTERSMIKVTVYSFDPLNIKAEKVDYNAEGGFKVASGPSTENKWQILERQEEPEIDEDYPQSDAGFKYVKLTINSITGGGRSDKLPKCRGGETRTRDLTLPKRAL